MPQNINQQPNFNIDWKNASLVELSSEVDKFKDLIQFNHQTINDQLSQHLINLQFVKMYRIVTNGYETWMHELIVNMAELNDQRKSIGQVKTHLNNILEQITHQFINMVPLSIQPQIKNPAPINLPKLSHQLNKDVIMGILYMINYIEQHNLSPISGQYHNRNLLKSKLEGFLSNYKTIAINNNYNSLQLKSGINMMIAVNSYLDLIRLTIIHWYVKRIDDHENTDYKTIVNLYLQDLN